MSIVKLNNRGVRNVSAFGSVAGGSMTFIKKLTASSSGTLSFVDGTSDVVLDDTYKEYLFTFNNIHPSEKSKLTFQANAAGGSGYNETMTTTAFTAYHNEAGNDTLLGYSTGQDQAQGTSFELLTDNIVDSGTTVANDNSASGYLILFNPSSTVFVKHFMSKVNHVNGGPYCLLSTHAGYFNTTSAIDEIQFKMSSGNIDAGDICLYGIK
tara:strand:- start:9 stop:638 length:630 start_codon:yes stop_codon:yes gene_type:complete